MAKKIKEQIIDETEKLEQDIYNLILAFEDKTGLVVKNIIKRNPGIKEQMKIKVILN